jgi:hypothetical protein
VRRQQAQLFNASSTGGVCDQDKRKGGDGDGDSDRDRDRNKDKDRPFDVLVASDAVGMGLNLTIRRVVFSTLEKFDGTRRRLLQPSVSDEEGREGVVCPVGSSAAWPASFIHILFVYNF